MPDDYDRKKFPSDTGNGVLMTPIGYAASKMLGMRYELCTDRRVRNDEVVYFSTSDIARRLLQ